jgi:hypothetical protein
MQIDVLDKENKKGYLRYRHKIIQYIEYELVSLSIPCPEAASLMPAEWYWVATRSASSFSLVFADGSMNILQNAAAFSVAVRMASVRPW